MVSLLRIPLILRTLARYTIGVVVALGLLLMAPLLALYAISYSTLKRDLKTIAFTMWTYLLAWLIVTWTLWKAAFVGNSWFRAYPCPDEAQKQA